MVTNEFKSNPISALLRFLVRLILFSCVFITIWQTCNCFIKYQKHPQSTSTLIDFTGDLPFPAITICSELDDERDNSLKGIPYNKTVLEECGVRLVKSIKNLDSFWAFITLLFFVISYGRYTCFNKYSECYFNGTGSDVCSDPERLYEETVVNQKEFIHRLRYRSFVPDWSPKYFSNYTGKDVWTVTYTKKSYGKCFTTVVDPDFAKKGIQEVLIHTKGDMRVFIHNPGVFHTLKQKLSFEVYYQTKAEYQVNHEVLKLLTFQNETCIDDPDYDRDKCTHERVYKVSPSNLKYKSKL